ncbi:B12-binding domain-containing protein [Streptomyces aureus]
MRAECRGLARAALRLESVAIQEQLNTFVQEHGVVAAWEELMMPTLHAVGRKWESSGDRYVEVEHLCPGTCPPPCATHSCSWGPARRARPALQCCWPASPANSTPCRSKPSTPPCCSAVVPCACSVPPSPPRH